MRQRLLWVVILLGLPRAAGADGVLGPGPEQILPRVKPSIEQAESSARPEPMLDLKLDAAQLPRLEGARSAQPDAQGRTASPVDFDEFGGKPPLSFGLKLKTRSEVGNEIDQDTTDSPGLGDKVESLLQRSTIGVTGTYHF